MPDHPYPEAWNIGLDLLKPSRRDLDYGLQLHRESLVVESYGLGLHAPVDPSPLIQAREAGHSPANIKHQLEKMKLTGWLAHPDLVEEYQRAWEASGVTCIFQNAGGEGNSPVGQIHRLACHTAMTDSLPDFLRRAAHPKEIRNAHANGQRCLYLTTNGVPLAGEMNTPAEEMRYIGVFASLGVRMMHLTYNRRNLLADGCVESANAGLSDFGAAVVREMNRQRVIVDLAHTGEKSSIQAARTSNSPVVISHATVAALCDHPRTKTDEVIRAIIDTGGTVGITNVPAFLGRTGDLLAFLDHIGYMVDRFGSESVSIGTDRPYQSVKSKPLPAELARAGLAGGWENFWPSSMPDGEPLTAPTRERPRQWASMSWTNWPLFTVGLVQRGYSDETIRAIIGGNILRVAEQVWEGPAAEQENNTGHVRGRPGDRRPPWRR